MTFQAPHCDSHPHSPSHFLALHQPLRRVCELCPLNGDRYVVGNQQFQSLSANAISELLQTQDKVMARHQQLRQLAVQTKADYGVEDDAVLQGMLRVIEGESREFKEVMARIKALRGKLQEVHRLISYFRALTTGRLIEIKMNLASEHGMKQFYGKCEQYAGLIRRGVHGEFKKIQAELATEELRLHEMEEGSLMARLRQCLLSRNLLVVAGKEEGKAAHPTN